MKAFVTIQNFGTIQQRLDLCETIERITGAGATLGEVGSVLIVRDPVDLGLLFVALANDPATDWIEYTVQFG